MATPPPPRTRRLAWRLEALGFDLFSILVRAPPPDVVSAIGAWLGRTVGPLTSSDRTARRNLEIALPEMPQAQRREVLRAQWENFGRYIFEFPIADRLTPASGRVEIVGAERLQAIARSGKPAVFISGHFSNIEIMAAVILASGVECDVTYRAANNPLVDERIKSSRFKYGIRLFAPKGAEGARDLLEALQAGRSIAILNDQKYDGGVAGWFFGHEVMTNPAAARLALRFGAPIQPLSIQRTRGARFRVIAHEPIIVEGAVGKTGAVEAGVQAINAFIEARVRERPGEWWWMHRRWPAAVYTRGT
ncbi:MAG TPA: lysophospholipid acyltransferase family protein [Phenylobacterium sp.]|jgi:KDO2-lipid IV(A) lauroyltransferase|uniref:lysophospholipid acyltransferase family protein n=1 Tax=Phenylobacterium sp. TaxID=1871053 RepID=UPI002D414105|nr:lysophospholipid acyltransferase family protein [Phenylobacterium sp.]HZZ67597.1 lysophospholipid acyltransferase family protein [Phenylobacterium sp.]